MNLANDWLSFYESMDEAVQHTQQYALMGYVSFVPVAFHYIFASTERQTFKFPRTFEISQQAETNTATLNEWIEEMTPLMRSYYTSTALVLDLLPLVFGLISPNLRPVPLTVMTGVEKNRLHDTVSTMVSLGLSYAQKRTVDGHYNYVVDPPITSLLLDEAAARTAKLPYSVKQVKM